MIYKDEQAIELVRKYAEDHLDKSDEKVEFDVYTVWKCKALQNMKYLISTSLSDGMYYEVTYNGDKNEVYLDAYKKFENRCINLSDTESTNCLLRASNDDEYELKIKKLQTLLEEMH